MELSNKQAAVVTFLIIVFLTIFGSYFYNNLFNIDNNKQKETITDLRKTADLEYKVLIIDGCNFIWFRYVDEISIIHSPGCQNHNIRGLNSVAL